MAASHYINIAMRQIVSVIDSLFLDWTTPLPVTSFNTQQGLI